MVMWTPIAQQRMLFLLFSILISCTKKFSDSFYEDKPKEKSAAKKSKNGKSTFKALKLLHNRESKKSQNLFLKMIPLGLKTCGESKFDIFKVKNVSLI